MNDPKCCCGMCEWEGVESDLAAIDDIWERVGAYETMPPGQCPDCGALAYYEAEPDWCDSARLKKITSSHAALISALEGLVDLGCDDEHDMLIQNAIAVLKDAKAI